MFHKAKCNKSVFCFCFSVCTGHARTSYRAHSNGVRSHCGRNGTGENGKYYVNIYLNPE